MKQFNYLYEAMVNISSIHTQMVCAVEEINELAQAIIEQDRMNILEECVDCTNMYYQLLWIYELDDSDFDDLLEDASLQSGSECVHKLMTSGIVLSKMATGKHPDGINPALIQALANMKSVVKRLSKEYSITEFELYNRLDQKMGDLERSIEDVVNAG